MSKNERALMIFSEVIRGLFWAVFLKEELYKNIIAPKSPIESAINKYV